MANYNSTEKRFPNAVEGMLAGRGLAFEADAPLEVIDFFSLDDEYDLDSEAIISSTIRREPFPRPSVIRKHRRTFAPLVWPDVFKHALDNVNDNAAISNHVLDTNKQKTAPYAGVGEEIIRELGRLTPGWAGENSVPPPDSVLRDVLTVTTLLPAEVIEPETEVDPDDGSVILRWMNEDSTSSFSLTFLGRGEVGGFLSSHPTVPAWKIRISETAHITSKIMSEGVLELITR